MILDGIFDANVKTATSKAVLKRQTAIFHGLVCDRKTPGCHCERPVNSHCHLLAALFLRDLFVRNVPFV